MKEKQALKHWKKLTEEGYTIVDIARKELQLNLKEGFSMTDRQLELLALLLQYEEELYDKFWEINFDVIRGLSKQEWE